MKKVLNTLAIIIVITLILMHVFAVFKNTRSSGDDYWKFIFIPNYELMLCANEVGDIVNVGVVEEINGDAVGQYQYAGIFKEKETRHTIVLKRTDINTIAHESFHAVYRIQRINRDKDEEHSAYMVGSLTQCIFNLNKYNEDKSLD